MENSLEARTAVTRPSSGAEEDGDGLVQSVSGKGGEKGMDLGYVLQAEEM